jgi:hypothetical protein
MTVLAKPVKTYLMDSILAVLKGVAGIAEVKDGPGMPIDQDIAQYPWVCFFDEAEEKKDANRITQKSFNLVVQTWFRKPYDATFRARADELDALQESALLNDEAIKLYCIKITASRADKYIVEESGNLEKFGFLQSEYRITYAHAAKNPYDLPGGTYVPSS